MTLTIVPRAQINCPEPPSSRSKLPKGLVPVLCHYTGGGTYGNGKTPALQEAKNIAAYGQSAGKTWEYNYLIGWDGQVFEQAGNFQAAHCSNFNSKSYGVLLMLGVGIKPTQQMINSWHALLSHLSSTGQISFTPELSPHYRYRATICPNTELADYPSGSWASPTGEGSNGNLHSFLLKASPDPPPVDGGDSLPFTEEQLAQIETLFRKVLNEGTGAGQVNWAGTSIADLATVQDNGNRLRTIQDKLEIPR